MNYTKGKWKALKFSEYHNWTVSMGDDDWFVDCGIDGEANAQLIASAPDLYEASRAFQLALAIWVQDPDKSPITLTTIFGETIGKALKKAEGK